MIVAYKWIIKKDNLYYSLINFNINPWMKDVYSIPYELNKTYNNPIKLDNRKNEILRFKRYYFELYGYHFWKYPFNENLEKWNRFFETQNIKEQIKSYLECEVEDVIKENEIRLICNRFTVLKERMF